MRENDKIYVKDFLNDMNMRVDHAIKYGRLKNDYIKKLTCKELAALCQVTPATITNLNTSSKFCLINKIAGEILDAYYAYYEYDERVNREQYPDEMIYPRDINYVIMCLTTYYTEEWING